MMKSNMLFTSMAALLVTTAANAATIKPFVGATMGLQGIIYTDKTEDAAKANSLDLPKDFVAFGLEGGFRFGAHSAIYNGGVTVSVDKTTDSNVEDKFTDHKMAGLDMFYASATYDNYIRLSGDKARRIDLVLGAGLGAMNYHLDPKVGDSETIWSAVSAFKIGLDFELTQHLTLSANTRVFVPARPHYIAESTYIVGGAVKYIF